MCLLIYIIIREITQMNVGSTVNESTSVPVRPPSVPVRPPSAPSSDSVSSAAAQKNLDDVTNLVKMKQHPHPTTVIMGFMLTMIVVYIFWTILCRSTPRGVWIDKDTKKHYEIYHGQLSGCLTVTDGQSEFKGKLYNGTLVLDSDPDKIGVWSGNNIFWTGSGGQVQIWNRELQIS